VIITWFHPGSVSPVWGVDARGRVTCTAGGEPEDWNPLARLGLRTVRKARGKLARLT
jgi:hypothetical protein